MSPAHATSDARRLEDTRQAIVSSLLRFTSGSPQFQPAPLPALSLFRLDSPIGQVCAVYEPGIALIAQGAKRVVLGADTFVYGAGQFLLTALNLPTVVQVLQASPSHPYLGLMLRLDPGEIGRLMLEGVLPPAPASQSNERAMVTGFVSLPLLSAFQRLLDLLDEPQNIEAVAPLIQREILYRLLASEHGERLRQIGQAGSQGHQIARAIDWLRVHFAKPLRIDDLASQVRMSSSTFHHHFRALTAMSPLQYQKTLRLNEARRLMLSESLDASTAAFRVGYESPSQFSREYSRQFGAPPLRDVTQLRSAAAPIPDDRQSA